MRNQARASYFTDSRHADAQRPRSSARVGLKALTQAWRHCQQEVPDSARQSCLQMGREGLEPSTLSGYGYSH
jgi:hypothetical protein